MANSKESWRHRIAFEVAMLLYILSKTLMNVAAKFYVTELVAIKYRGDLSQRIEEEKNSTNGSSSNIPSLPSTKPLPQMDREVSSLLFNITLCELVPSVLVVIIYGILSDKLGKRKFLLYLPPLGTIFFAMGLVLPNYLAGADVDNIWTKVCFYIGSVFSGLMGSSPGFYCGNGAYISDVEPRTSRTPRFSTIEFFFGISLAFGAILFQMWTPSLVVYQIFFWGICGVSLGTFLFILFFMQEPPLSSAAKLCQITPLYAQIGMFCLSVCGFMYMHKKIWCLFTLLIIYASVHRGQCAAADVYLIREPFLWSLFHLAIFNALINIFSALASWPGIPLIERLTNHLAFAFVAIILKIISSMIYAIPVQYTIYIAGILEIPHLIPFVVGRSFISQNTKSSVDHGKIFGLLQSLIALSQFIGVIYHSMMYAYFVTILNGLVFIVSGLILLVPMLLVIYIYRLNLLDPGYQDIDELDEEDMTMKNKAIPTETSAMVASGAVSLSTPGVPGTDPAPPKKEKVDERKAKEEIDKRKTKDQFVEAVEGIKKVSMFGRLGKKKN